MGYWEQEQIALLAAIAVCSRPKPTPSDIQSSFFRFSFVLTEHYQRPAALDITAVTRR
jgi:hypothetical protein